LGFLTLKLKIDNSAPTVSHEKYIKYASLPWPPEVAAQYRNKLALAQ